MRRAPALYGCVWTLELGLENLIEDKRGSGRNEGDP